MRSIEVRVRLSDDEAARLDEMKPRGSSRASFLRSFLNRRVQPDEVASRAEALAMLTAQARDGKVAAAIALERALREEREEQPDDELERLLAGS
jgi:hypothetical protein